MTTMTISQNNDENGRRETPCYVSLARQHQITTTIGCFPLCLVQA